MTSSRFIIKPLALACAIALTACSSGGDSSTPTATTISGLAEAPGGVIAQLKYNQSFMVAAIERIFPGAYAAITGLDPVTGATVELIRVDNDGNQVGDVLASTTTSITGDYSLALPSGVDFSGDLVLRITGNSGTSMSAQVVEQSVDINPISQYILDKFIEDGTELASLPVNDVVALTGKIEEFDLTAAPGTDLTAMLDQLEAEVGTFVDNQITVINSVPGDGSTVAGNWKLFSFSVGFHDSEGQGFGTYAIDMDSSSFAVADSGNGSIELTESGYEGVWTNAYSGGGLDVESEIGSGEDTFPGSVDADGNIVVESPFEEELQTVDTQVDVDGPDYGWRWPPSTILIDDTGSGNSKFAVFQDAGARYLTTDTNNDGVKDAVDPNAKDGDEVSLQALFLLKQGTGMGAGSAQGSYGMVNYSVGVGSLQFGEISSEVGIVTFDGTNTVDIASNAVEEIRIERSYGQGINLNATTTLDPTSQSLGYSVAANGEFAVLENQTAVLEGQVSADGSLIVAVAHDETVDNKGDTDPSNDEITNSSNDIRTFVKLGSGLQSVDLADSTYDLRPLIQNAESSGRQAIFTLSRASTIVFDADGGNAVITPSDRGIERDNDGAEIQAIAVETPQAMQLPVQVSGNGHITMEDANSGVYIEGYVAEDTSMFIGRVYITDPQSANTSEDLGLVVGIKQ